jgi:hypothetical protein
MIGGRATDDPASLTGDLACAMDGGVEGAGAAGRTFPAVSGTDPGVATLEGGFSSGATRRPPSCPPATVPVSAVVGTCPAGVGAGVVASVSSLGLGGALVHPTSGPIRPTNATARIASLPGEIAFTACSFKTFQLLSLSKALDQARCDTPRPSLLWITHGHARLPIRGGFDPTRDV